MQIGILISGRGSNMQHLVAASRSGEIGCDVAVIVSNRADAPGLAWAKRQSLRTVCIPHGDHPSREAHDQAVVEALLAHSVELVCLAGYMRILCPGFIDTFPDRIINIHPSLLPAFPGVSAQRQAIDYGVRISGATVHFVDSHLDHGPIILQESVSVHGSDTVDALSARILEVEHRLYPRAAALIASGKVTVTGRRVHLKE